jgi:hypothetical protein
MDSHPNGELGFILMLRLGRVSGRSGKYRGTGGTAVLNFFYVYYQFPFLLSLPKNRNYPSQASHFGVKFPQVEAGNRFMAAGRWASPL